MACVTSVSLAASHHEFSFWSVSYKHPALTQQDWKQNQIINSCRILLKLSWAVFKVSARWNLLRLSDLWCSTALLALYNSMEELYLAMRSDTRRYLSTGTDLSRHFHQIMLLLVPLLICVSHIFHPFKPVRSALCVYCCLWDKCKLIFGACAITTDMSSRWNVNTVWKGPLPGLTLFLLWGHFINKGSQ